MNTYGRRRVTRSFQIPYCAACSSRAGSFSTRGILYAGVAFVLAAAVAALPLAITALPLVVVVGLALGVGLVFGIVVKTVLSPQHPPLPATTPGRAVTLVKFNMATSTLHCTNMAWGQEFAQRNNVQPIPKKRGHGFGTGALVVGLLFGPLGAGVAWGFAHPSVHIDNAGSEALQIYVDGDPEIVVAPNVRGVEPPTINVPYGRHTFGASRKTASKPESTFSADVTMNDAHLYNPGKTACYWLIAASYGSGSVAGMSQGPQPIQEFYSFDNVNTWFGDNPQSINVQNGQTGGTRVALQRAGECMAIARANCPLAVREQFVQCQRAARDEATFDACSATAKTSCSGGAPTATAAVATATPAHSASPVAPHPASHPPPVPPPRKK
jgi:hypothetical protein